MEAGLYIQRDLYKHYKKQFFAFLHWIGLTFDDVKGEMAADKEHAFTDYLLFSSYC